MWLHSYTQHEQEWIAMQPHCIVHCAALRLCLTLHSEIYTSQTGLDNVAA